MYICIIHPCTSLYLFSSYVGLVYDGLHFVVVRLSAQPAPCPLFTWPVSFILVAIVSLISELCCLHHTSAFGIGRDVVMEGLWSLALVSDIIKK